MEQLLAKQIKDFQQTLRRFYKAHGRDLPWRHTTDPYKILVSELMLQQTQVSRVVPKYELFLQKFPTPQALAGSSLADVLLVWSGLGYNRRAKYLWQAAQIIERDHAGQVPSDYTKLINLPGVGANTAGAVLAYAYNLPAVFIETNVRSVFLEHFYPEQLSVSDSDIKLLIGQTLDRSNPRQWYWSVMDYGTYLKQSGKSHLERAAGHSKQPPFQGSRRQVRGSILRQLGGRPQTLAELVKAVADERTADVIEELLQEHLISTVDGRYLLG